MNAGKKVLANSIINKDEALRLSLQEGSRIKNCRCHETLPQDLGLCKWCADQRRRDLIYLDNMNEMFGGDS